MIRQAAIIGGGVIGSGWAARFLMAGWNVRIFDPNPNFRNLLERYIDNARRSYPALYDASLPPEGEIQLCNNPVEAVRGADWIQECVPERLDVKQRVYAALQEICQPETPIASSTSGFTPTDLQQGAIRPQDIFVAHPYNPVYLLPLVELVGSSANLPASMEAACSTLRAVGMVPIHLRKEIDAHIGDRLLEAAWREALWLVRDDYATTEEIDDVIRLGFGLRWAQMGIFETYRIAGGDDGMAHFIEQFGPCLKLPWSRLTDVPDLNEELVEKIASQTETHGKDYSCADLERIRDDNLVTILRGLKSANWGAGSFLRDAEKRLATVPPSPVDGPMVTACRVIPADWMDYNGHMNESRYLECFSKSTDIFLERCGCNSDYIASGRSFFTVETNMRHFGEVKAGDQVTCNTICLRGGGKKLHLHHSMLRNGEDLVAEAEHLLIHVDLETRKSSEPLPSVATILGSICDTHGSAALPNLRSPRLSFER